MTPTVDDFQALARSSPWRWMSLHFAHRSEFPGDCEAWVRRPGEVVVRTVDGKRHRESGLPYTTSMNVSASSDPDFVPPVPPVPVLPHQAAPVLRADGLVAERPSSFDVNYDDPMYGNYSWVAMLDPVELSHDVEISDLRVEDVAGPPAWRPSVRALPEYDPRCSCCPLVWSEVSDRYEHDDSWVPTREYPDHYDVALDVQTGVVVRCLPVGGDPNAAWLENDILEVG